MNPPGSMLQRGSPFGLWMLSRQIVGRPAPASFCVALRPQPIDATTSLQPLIDFGLALEALDVAKFGARIVSFDLPLVFGDALVFEFDSGFAHAVLLAVFGRRG
jgi:hypothetical protein